MVFPVAMYGCESWTVKKAEHRRIDAFEVWCYRNKKDHKRVLSTIICQYNGQRGRNGLILRKVQLSKTGPGRNRKS